MTNQIEKMIDDIVSSLRQNRPHNELYNKLSELHLLIRNIEDGSIAYKRKIDNQIQVIKELENENNRLKKIILVAIDYEGDK